MTENAAKTLNIHCNTGRFPFAALGRATAEEDSGCIPGVHITGKNAGELIAAMTLAARKGVTAAEVGETIQAHPTYSDAFKCMR